MHKVLFDRVCEHLPQSNFELQQTSSNGTAEFSLHSINRRWRFFRYGQGCVYRPHIDGSWPESRITEKETYETDDTSGNTKSFLTFLIYLNDDFSGGATRFYHATKMNGMVARGVQPKMGCVLVFPQGNTASLLHEGSAVTEGTKYVIRTDVLYSRNGVDVDDNN